MIQELLLGALLGWLAYFAYAYVAKRFSLWNKAIKQLLIQQREIDELTRAVRALSEDLYIWQAVNDDEKPNDQQP